MIDKRMLVDTVTIQKPAETDKWGKETYSDPITLKNVRFDRSTSHAGSGQNRSENNFSVLLVYPKYTPIELDDSWLNGRVNDTHRDYIIRKIIPQYHPFNHKILCYEIEVI
nr:MAG TPA: Minor capsid protein [Caudoviricetes sp.]